MSCKCAEERRRDAHSDLERLLEATVLAAALMAGPVEVWDGLRIASEFATHIGNGHASTSTVRRLRTWMQSATRFACNLEPCCPVAYIATSMTA